MTSHDGPDMSMLSPRELRQRYGAPDNGGLNERVAASIARPGGGTQGRHMTERSGGGQSRFSASGSTKWETLLAASKSLYVKQHVELFEAMTGMETENKYSVFGPTRSGCMAHTSAVTRRAFHPSRCAWRCHANRECVRWCSLQWAGWPGRGNDVRV